MPFLAVLSGCQFSENRYLTRPVKPGEAVGTWRATEYAIKSLREVGVREHLTVQEHKLVLRPDGVLLDPDRHEHTGFFGGRRLPDVPDTGCRWRLGEGGHPRVDFELTPAPSLGNPYFYFAEEDGRLLLWQYATDPDAWLYMEFEKTGT